MKIPFLKGIAGMKIPFLKAIALIYQQ